MQGMPSRAKENEEDIIMGMEKLNDNHFLIKEIVESYVEDWKAKSGQRDHQKRNYFYMSDVSKCPRAIFYDFTCPERKRPIMAKTLMMFHAGNLIHDDIQARARLRRLVEAGRDIEFGVEDWAHKATGRLDLIVAVHRFIKEDNGIAVAEIKTKNPYGFGEGEAEEGEVDQLLWYIDRLKESAARSVRQSNVLDYGFLIYIDRAMVANPMPICGWRVDYDADRVAAIKARFTALDKAIIANECPARPYERESIKCTYCRYEAHCWEGIPKPEAPAFMADESVEPPEQELVDSMATHYLKMRQAKLEAEIEMEKAEAVLMRYFKATGQESLAVAGQQIARSLTKHTGLDGEFLFAELSKRAKNSRLLLNLWKAITAPKTNLIQQAIKDGKFDAGLFEQAKRISWIESLRVKKNKGE